MSNENEDFKKDGKDESLLAETLLEKETEYVREVDEPILQENLSPSKSEKQDKQGFKAFLAKQGIEISFKRYAVDALGAMALGLFASLLIGTIINTAASLIGLETSLGSFLHSIGNYATAATGGAMAVAVAYSLNAPPLVLFSMLAVGLAANELAGAGGPLAVYFIALITTEIGKLVSKTTKIDITLTPLVCLLVGGSLSFWLAPVLGSAANSIGNSIMWATEQQPFLMGVLVSVIMGIVLTLPISSAALAAAFGLVGLAGGAAHAGCCAQMVGFAVMSYKENKLGGLLAQGLGTSMLQMPNIVKNPRIWLPPILCSAVTGPLATVVFKLEMNGAPISSGMGTSGLVGPIGIVTGWLNPSAEAISHGATALAPGLMDYLGLILISFVLPAILTYLFAIPLRKIKWIKDDDLKLNLG